MKTKIIMLLKKPFVKSVVIMATGTIGAQIIKMGFSPIITRLYGPEAFGIMGVFISVIQIIIPIAALTYPFAIVLPKNDINAKKLMKLSIILSLVIAVIILSILLIFNKQIISIFNLKNISNFLFLIPLVVLLTTFMQVFEQWYIRKKQFKVNAKVTFYQTLIIESGKIGVGVFYPFASVLVIFTVLTNGIKGLLLGIFGRKTELKYEEEEVLSMKSLAKKYKDFPIWRAPQKLIDATTQTLPVFMLTSFFSPLSAGFYTLCRSVLTIPSTFIGDAVGNVFYPRINEAAHKKENLNKLIKKAVLSLSCIGVLPYGLIIIFGPWLFSFIFGSEWVIAGEYARWLALWRFFRFINEPCIKTFPVLNAQPLHFKITVIQTVSGLIALGSGFYFFKNDTIAIALYSLSGSIFNIIIIITSLYISNKFDASNIIK
ncbi:lipopolysaccharide biosynthesis protein [Oceanobacillus kimchii]|uniref:lipopolysaccharide biosynthesis protein n=1 Tax=Oceanobacillus kimchii TaxID=746691 RepID=UPI0003450A29|nr:oligosaccharide flippase family protein [Oceanobacillus kimchii]